jgi:hypothetical protein
VVSLLNPRREEKLKDHWDLLLPSMRASTKKVQCLLKQACMHKYDRYLRKIDLRTIEDWDERARQNVILEFGYFIGKLRRDRVCCLHKGKVELPSDMQGIVYIPFKDSIEEARDMIIKELKEAGYEIKKTSRETKYLEV